MNKESSVFWEKELLNALMGAIQDAQKWGDVLEIIMNMTGAKAAIITLRDKYTCQIVNDVELEARYHSPLIRGFSTDAIVHYLTNLRTIDPWAEYQRTSYPYRPTQMSKVCPKDSVPGSRFFDWLDTLGFEDTVVFELDRMAGYWTAINLFLEKSDSRESQRVLNFANEYYDLMRKAWVASQCMSQTRQSNAALLDRAAGSNTATCIVGPNGELLECNEKFQAALQSGAVRVSGQERKLSFGKGVRIVGVGRWEQHDLLRHGDEGGEATVTATALDPDPIFAGKREKHWLLTYIPGNTAGSILPKLGGINLNVLTRQEQDLYAKIAEGMSVDEAGRSIRLKRSRSFEVWSSVKDKLGIKAAHQLRA